LPALRSTNGRHLHEAVHLAVTLDYYGLLRATPSATTLAQRGLHDRVLVADIDHSGRLLQTVTVGRGGSAAAPVVAIDLARLYSLYALYVLAASPELPCRYYVTLRDDNHRVERLACHLAESRAFATLAGPMPYAGGVLRPAATASFLSCYGSDVVVVPHHELCRILITAGAVVQDSSSHFDALQLYLRVGAPGPGEPPTGRGRAGWRAITPFPRGCSRTRGRLTPLAHPPRSPARRCAACAALAER